MVIMLNEKKTQASGVNPLSEQMTDVTLSNFPQKVIEPCMQSPVVVYFYRSDLKDSFIDRFLNIAQHAQVTLCRVDAMNPKNQSLLVQLRLQSVPAVYAFHKGRPVDGFMGALPDDQLTAFFEKLIGGPLKVSISALLKQAQEYEKQHHWDQACDVYLRVLEHEPGHLHGLWRSSWCLFKQGKIDKMREIIGGLSPDLAAKEPVCFAVAHLKMIQEQETLKSWEQLTQGLEKNPNEHALRFDRAKLNFLKDEPRAAIDDLIYILKDELSWNDHGAQKQLVEFFNIWGPGDPQTLAGRRDLSMIIFK